MRPLLSIASATLLLAITGCGGAGSSSASYSAAATRDCLSATAADVDPDPTNVDAIALDASGGAIRVIVHGNEAIVSFGSDSDEAGHIANAYSPFGAAVDQRGNAVVAWSDTPTDSEKHVITDCLR